MKNKIIVIIISIALLITIGVTYAYFTSNVSGNESKVKIASKEISVIFTDTKEITNLDITPGWSDSKTFTIENKSSGTYNYNIVFSDLINTFVTDGSLQYKITSSNGGYNMTEWSDIPKSDTKDDKILVYDIDIEKGVTQEYTIEFRYYDNPDIDQSEDIGKDFSGSLMIAEGTVNPNIKYSVTLNVENATVEDTNIKETIKKGSVEFNVTPDEGYTLGTIVTCDNNANGVIENGKVTISNITANTICSLTNNINTYEITMNVINGRSNALNKIVNYNENAEFTITPNTGYTLTGATLEGEGCTIENNIVKVSNVKSNGTCTLTLPRDKYKVILIGSNVTVSDSPKEVEYEGSTTFNVVPSTGFTMSEASVNCDGGASTNINENQVTISNVLKAQTCTITPKQITYEVELVVVNGTGNTIKTIAHGGNDTFNISANSTYTLENPDISCTGSAANSYNNGVLTISNVTGSQTCTVTLKHTSYLVTVTSNNNNYGTVSPTSQYIVHGNSATITLSPKTNYKYSSNDCGGTVDGNTMTISNITTTKNCTVTFVTALKTLYATLSDGAKYTLGSRNTASTSPIEGTTTTQGFKVTSNGIDYTGGIIFKTGNDYYFAGNPSDNWVKFADKWWRIIRTNSSEGTKLLYAGTTHDGQDGYISNITYVWNSSYDSDTSMYWNKSSFKSSLNNWYAKNVTGTNDNMVNSIVYCNDISYTTHSNNKLFGAYSRLYSSKSPTYSCGANQFGSAAKVAITTADEIAYAGGVHKKNSSNTYYYRNSKTSGCTESKGDPCSVTGGNSWWTMSPFTFPNAEMFTVYGAGSYSGGLNSSSVHNSHAVRPVITLKPEVLVLGNGTTDDPFIPSL